MINFIDLKKQYKMYEKNIKENIFKVLESGNFIMGPQVEEMETMLKDSTGSRYCISVSSGTEALLISLMAIGIKKGDEVITSSFSFISVVEMIKLLGAKAILVDIEKDTCNIDTSILENKITSKTKAIIPVSLYGQPANFDEINIIAKKYNINVIEDAAQSFGSTYKGRKSTNLSHIGCTSFFPSKPLGCYGDGGAIFTNDEKVADICRQLRVHGQTSRYKHVRVGVGGRMDTIQCAVIIAKLKNFENEIKSRQAIAQEYDEIIDSMGITRVQVKNDRTSVYAQYSIFPSKRSLVINQLEKFSIPYAIHYPKPISSQVAYSEDFTNEKFPNAEEVSKTTLSLPMHPFLTSKDIRFISEALKL